MRGPLRSLTRQISTLLIEVTFLAVLSNSDPCFQIEIFFPWPDTLHLVDEGFVAVVANGRGTADIQYRRRSTVLPMTALRRERAEIPYTPPARCGLRRMNDRIRIDAVVMIEIGDRSGLAEMLHP